MMQVSTAADLAVLTVALGELPQAADEAERIDRIRQFETLKAVIAAAQMAEAAGLDRSQRAAHAAAGVPGAHQGRGIAAQVALARRVSPWQAQRWLGWAKVLTTELPATYAELRAGRTSEWRALLVARETVPLSRDDRAAVDAELAPGLHAMGDRKVEAQARAAVFRLDPAGAVERAAAAAADRRVTMRPAPDVMARLTLLAPVAQAVATYAALCRRADTATAAGDRRGRGQIMADTLVERVTGQATADDVPIEIELLITDDTVLTHTSTEPAVVPGYGPIPAGIARELALGRDVDTAPRWIRRLYRRPDGGGLGALETRRRTFTDAQRRFLRLRDQTCRTSWCDAPIRHADHVVAHHDGGVTSTDNGEGLCAACNHAKQAPGWSTTVDADGTVTTRTPTGHRSRSRPPDPPRERISDDRRRLRALVAAGRLVPRARAA